MAVGDVMNSLSQRPSAVAIWRVELFIRQTIDGSLRSCLYSRKRRLVQRSVRARGLERRDVQRIRNVIALRNASWRDRGPISAPSFHRLRRPLPSLGFDVCLFVGAQEDSLELFFFQLLARIAMPVNFG